MQDIEIFVRVLRGTVKGPKCSKSCKVVNDFQIYLDGILQKEPESGVLWKRYCLLHEKHCSISNV
ncbi:MAG: hypothetical protein PHH06_04895 [Candidatus Gracilibacteria bacterium]|nr:hypothetical protein [Candidatus Gracilibacteria bacterium]